MNQEFEEQDHLSPYQQKVKFIIAAKLTNGQNVTILKFVNGDTFYAINASKMLDLCEQLAKDISQYDQEVMNLDLDEKLINKYSAAAGAELVTKNSENQKLTIDEACKIVVDIWGIDGRCWTEKGYRPFSVGLGGIGRSHIIKGTGNSWEEALYNAGIKFIKKDWIEVSG